jgi:hypothetical protein
MERRVPWKDWGEWFDAYRLLFSQDARDRQRGLGIVTNWRVFGSVGVPVSIDSTAHIIEIRDDEHLQLHSELFRLSMTSAITRLVNGVVEENQISVFADSVMRIARRIDLPETLVELRHGGTHDALPSFSVLKHASQVALNWLYERYWVKQADKIQLVRNQLESIIHNIAAIVGRRRQTGGVDKKQWKEENEFKNEIAKEVWENIAEMRKYVQSPNDIFDFLVPSFFSHELAKTWLWGGGKDEELKIWIQKSTKKTWKLFFIGICDAFPTFPRVMFQHLVRAMELSCKVKSHEFCVEGPLMWLSFFLHQRQAACIHPTTLGSVLHLLRVLVQHRAFVDSQLARTLVRSVSKNVRENDGMKGTIIDRMDFLWDMMDKYDEGENQFLKSLDDSVGDGALYVQKFSRSFQQSAIGEVPYVIVQDADEFDEDSDFHPMETEGRGHDDDDEESTDSDMIDCDGVKTIRDETGNVYYLF